MSDIKKEGFFTVYGQKNGKNLNFNMVIEYTKAIYL